MQGTNGSLGRTIKREPFCFGGVKIIIPWLTTDFLKNQLPIDLIELIRLTIMLGTNFCVISIDNQLRTDGTENVFDENQ